MNWFNNIAKVVISGLAGLSLNCKASVRLQSEALDHPLSFRQRLGLHIHLMLCKWCRRYGKQITFVRDAAHSHADQMAKTVSQQLSSEARERIRQKLRTQSRSD